MEGSEGSIVSSFTPTAISQLHRPLVASPPPFHGTETEPPEYPGYFILQGGVTTLIHLLICCLKPDNKSTLPAHPSSASVSSSSSPFRFSALIMVGRGTLSICCRTGRVGRDRPSLLSLLQGNAKKWLETTNSKEECRAELVIVACCCVLLHVAACCCMLLPHTTGSFAQTLAWFNVHVTP